MPVAANIIEMAETGDAAKRRILDEVEPLMERSGMRAVGGDILIAVYDRAGQKTAGGVYIPGSNEEDRFQGKVGLVLDVGPMLLGNPEYIRWFGGTPPKKGDWVGVNTRDGISGLLGSTTVRLVEWKYIRFLIDRPDLVM